MDKFLENITSINTDIAFVILLALFFTVEQILEKGSTFKDKGVHLFHSIVLQAGYILLNILTATVFVGIFEWIVVNRIGLLNQIEIPFLLKIFVGILVIDFVGYWAHRLNHQWHLFWRLHRVYHSDTKMDSSTSFRAHPLDLVLDNS